MRTPHIGGTLEIVTLDRRRFREVDSEKGFSNHVFGSTELGMSAVARINDDNIADLAVPDQDRRVLRFMTVAGGSLREIGRVPLDGVDRHRHRHAQCDGPARPSCSAWTMAA